MKKCIVVTYKNGSTVHIDVPEFYYNEKYRCKSDKWADYIFKKEYSRFIKAMNMYGGVVRVGKYLKFSDATVTSKDVLSIDIKEFASEDEEKPLDSNVFIPGIYDRIYLDLSDTKLEKLIDKIDNLGILEDLKNLIKKPMEQPLEEVNIEISSEEKSE